MLCQIAVGLQFQNVMSLMLHFHLSQGLRKFGQFFCSLASLKAKTEEKPQFFFGFSLFRSKTVLTIFGNLKKKY